MLVAGTVCSWLPGIYPSLGQPFVPSDSVPPCWILEAQLHQRGGISGAGSDGHYYEVMNSNFSWAVGGW